MTHPKHSCSGFDGADLEIDEELRNILDAMFCCCLGELQNSKDRLCRDLFRLTEMEGQTPAAAARQLGLEVSQAEGMLARTRRDIAVLRALGLFTPRAEGTADAPRTRDCRCGHSTPP